MVKIVRPAPILSLTEPRSIPLQLTMPHLRRVLFVDDDANVLSGLQRLLRPMRQEWQMRFATGGADALAILAEEPVDVIVTDMRMPEMDGPALLDEVSRSHPGVARIVLSGQADRESTLRAVGPAHQYLSKPCSADELIGTLRQAFGLRDLLDNDALRALVARLRSLPSMPAVYVELTNEMRSENASVRRVAEIVEKDPALTAKVLQLVNSAFFGARVRIATAQQAVQMLGLDLVRALTVSAQLVAQLEPAAAKRFMLTGLWHRSLTMSRIVRRLAACESLDAEAMGHAVTAATLHDAGRLALALCLPDDYGAIVDRAMTERMPLVHVEQDVLGCTHAEVGAYLLGLWGLPSQVTTAVAGHHRPASSGVTGVTPLALVHAVDAIVSELLPEADPMVAPLFDLGFLASIGARRTYEAWKTESKRIVEQR